MDWCVWEVVLGVVVCAELVWGVVGEVLLYVDWVLGVGGVGVGAV